MKNNNVGCSAALAATLFLFGCNPWATYPPVETTAKLSSAATEPIPTLMAEGIRAAHEKYGDKTGGDFAINLPPGTPAKVYDKVIKDLGGGHPQAAADTRVYHVTEVRARDFDGEVDIIMVKPDGVAQFMTVSLHSQPFGSYKPEGIRLWRYAEPVPAPNYVAAPAEAEPAATKPD